MQNTKSIPLLRVNQFLNSWNDAEWNEDRPRPDDHFFVGSISIDELRVLSGVSERKAEYRSQSNLVQGYQRAHEPKRSEKIGRYIKFGYPMSTSLGLDPAEHKELINPGWLPNAIIINIMEPGESRMRGGRQRTVPEELKLSIVEKDQQYRLRLPTAEWVKEYTKGRSAYALPIEVIDGQHRLYAVDTIGKLDGKFEVPVVIFNNLKPSWQAYIFWTINVEPKKINASLAFDLYPELRRQTWLNRGETIKIYQEHRSQELTEILWRHEKSPWRERIELHGGRTAGRVSNASFIRSLNSSFIRKWGAEDKIGGLFGSIATEEGTSLALPWTRAQQAAFLIQIWSSLNRAVTRHRPDWARQLQADTQLELDSSLAVGFAGPHTLLATDQGVRAIHNIFNAVFQAGFVEFELEEWTTDDEPDEETSNDAVTVALHALLNRRTITRAIDSISDAAVLNFDWRTYSAPGLGDAQRQVHAGYRGSGGYSLLTKNVLIAIDRGLKDDSLKPIVRNAMALSSWS
jgi:hypothetical protein